MVLSRDELRKKLFNEVGQDKISVLVNQLSNGGSIIVVGDTNDGKTALARLIIAYTLAEKEVPVISLDSGSKIEFEPERNFTVKPFREHKQPISHKEYEDKITKALNEDGIIYFTESFSKEDFDRFKNYDENYVGKITTLYPEDFKKLGKDIESVDCFVIVDECKIKKIYQSVNSKISTKK